MPSSSSLKRLGQRLAAIARSIAVRLFPPLRILPSPTAALALLSLQQVRAENRFAAHLVSWAAVSSVIVAGNVLSHGSEEFWSPVPVGFWAVGVALDGLRVLRRRRRRYEAEHRRLGQAAAGAAAADVGRLRRALLGAAEAARKALRSANPEIAAEISRGETEALAVVAWLDQAERLRPGGRVEADLRRQAAKRLSEPGHGRRSELERLVAELDRNDGRRAALDHQIAQRRAHVESFLLVIENVKLAQGGAAAPGGVAPAVAASIRERVALLAEPGAEVSAGSRLRQEVRLARDLQRSILPAAAPAVAGLEVAHVYRPSSEVGGDFYDFYVTDSGCLLIALGDASGHGIDSSMVSSMAKSALYMQVAARRHLEAAFARNRRPARGRLRRRHRGSARPGCRDPLRRRCCRSWLGAVDGHSVPYSPPRRVRSSKSSC